jgi:N-acetylmuramoyl-L-alanine amidase
MIFKLYMVRGGPIQHQSDPSENSHSNTAFRAMTQLTSDSALVGRVVPSPNHGVRKGEARPVMIVLHYTGLANAEAALKMLCSAQSELSAHYIVLEDGLIVQCVAEARRAWHAGLSSWAGETDINSHSIGIEIVNPGHELGYPDFTGAQIESVIALCDDIVARQRISRHRVLGHSDVAPSRKRDPGEKFPWRLLYESGLGHWVEPEPIAENSEVLGPGDAGQSVRALQTALSEYGYGAAVNAVYDVLTGDVVTAFQRHFRPAKIDGIADASTIKTLDDLLLTRPQCPS